MNLHNLPPPGPAFAATEREYARLRRQLEERKITPAQFDAALDRLMLRDARGQFWMLGRRDGRWYSFAGGRWRESLPSGAAQIAPMEGVRPLVLDPTAQKPAAGCLPRLLGGGIILGLVFVALAVLASGEWPRVAILSPSSQSPTPETSDPPTAWRTRTASLVEQTGTPPSAVTIEPLATPILATAMPPTIPIAPISAVAQLSFTRTATRAASPTPQPTLTVGASSAATRAFVPPTLTPVPTSTVTPSSTLIPGVFVTGVRPDPSQPARGEGIRFRVTFVNSTGEPQGYEMLVRIYEPSPLRRFAATTPRSVTVPAGVGEAATAGDWKLGPSGCQDFLAQVEFQNEDRTTVVFLSPDGSAAWFPFRICV